MVNLPSTLFYCFKREAARSVVFDRTSYPPLILAFFSSVHICYPSPFDTNAYICSVAPYLRVLWMSTHGYFAPSFPLFPFLLGCRNQTLEPRIQTPPSMMNPTTLEVATTTCRPLTTTMSSLGGSQAGGLRLFRCVPQFVLAFVRHTCLLMSVLTYCCFR